MSLNSTHRCASLALFVTSLCSLTGCGEDVGVALVPVTGVVTLDSRPLANARVVFSPQSGRPSSGTTDAAGRYEVFYTVDEPGVLPGSHTISISTFLEPDSDSGDPDKQQGRPESVPAIYNRKSTLTQEIPPEHSAPVNFELKSTPDGRTAAN